MINSNLIFNKPQKKTSINDQNTRKQDNNFKSALVINTIKEMKKTTKIINILFLYIIRNKEIK